MWASALSIPDTTVFGTVLGNATLRGAILQRQTALLPMSLLLATMRSFKNHSGTCAHDSNNCFSTPPYNTGILLSNSYCIGSTGE